MRRRGKTRVQTSIKLDPDLKSVVEKKTQGKWGGMTSLIEQGLEMRLAMSDDLISRIEAIADANGKTDARVVVEAVEKGLPRIKTSKT